MPRSTGFEEEPRHFEDRDESLRSVPYQRLKVDSAGRIVIPAEMRAAMMIKPGDTVSANVVEGEFSIVSPKVSLRRVKALAREWKAENPGVGVVDELIAERREEARRELVEANAWRKSHGLPPLE